MSALTFFYLTKKKEIISNCSPAFPLRTEVDKYGKCWSLGRRTTADVRPSVGIKDEVK